MRHLGGPAAVFLASAVLVGCGRAGTTAGATPTPAAGEVTVNTPADCQRVTSGSIQAYSVGVADNGKHLRMVRCQALAIVLQAPTTEEGGCRWAGIRNSAEKVMAVLRAPLPTAPPGATQASYQSVGSGTAQLASNLVCQNAPPRTFWSVTIDVAA